MSVRERDGGRLHESGYKKRMKTKGSKECTKFAKKNKKTVHFCLW